MKGSRYLTFDEIIDIKIQLLKKGLNASTLADKLNLDRSNISMILNQKRKMTTMLESKLKDIDIIVKGA